MLAITEPELFAMLGAWLWPFMRVTGFLIAAPIVGTRTVPVRIRVILALALTSVLVPLAQPATPIDPGSAEGLLTGIQQIIIGAAMGLVLRLVFFVFEFAGQLVSQQTGLGFAALVDPQSGAQVPVIAHFYLTLVTLLFFALDAHLMLVELLADSFRLLPVGPAGVSAAGAETVLNWSAQLIGASVVLGLPILVALLAINFALGVMARSAPQLNIFAVGFPVMILFGVVLVALTLEQTLEHATRLLGDGLGAARLMLEAR